LPEFLEAPIYGFDHLDSSGIFQDRIFPPALDCAGIERNEHGLLRGAKPDGLFRRHIHRIVAYGPGQMGAETLPAAPMVRWAMKG
jgi:hypothetical protein